MKLFGLIFVLIVRSGGRPSKQNEKGDMVKMLYKGGMKLISSKRQDYQGVRLIGF